LLVGGVVAVIVDLGKSSSREAPQSRLNAMFLIDRRLRPARGIRSILVVAIFSPPPGCFSPPI